MIKACILAITLLPAFSAKAQPEDTQPLPAIESIVKDALHKQQLIRIKSENYCFTETATTTIKDNKGKTVKEEVKKYETVKINGHTIKQLVMVNGKPLTEKECAKELSRIQKESQDAAKEDSEESIKKIGANNILKTAKIIDAKRTVFQNIKAIDLKFTTSDIKPKNKQDEFISKLAGHLFLDETTYELIGFNAKLMAPVKFWGGVLASFSEGTTINLDTIMVNNDIRMPSRMTLALPTRVLFFKMNIYVKSEFSDHKNFTLDTVDISKPTKL